MVKAWRWVKGKMQPVTVLFTLLMLLAYARSTHLDRLLQPQIALAWRTLLSVFCHKSRLHLFVNVMWTLNIGAHFEKLHGSWHFLGTTILMIFLSQGLMLLIYFPYTFFTMHCLPVIIPTLQLNNHTFLGFSGVLFALYFLLETSSPYHSGGQGVLLSSRHHGLRVQGLFLLAGLQTFILPDSCFLNNLSGIVAGVVHINIPPILTVWTMIVYMKMIHPMYHTMYEDFQTLGVTLKGYYHCLCHQYSQGRGSLHTNHSDDDDHQGQDDEEEDNEEAMDPTLQWECKTCLRKNGVFLCFCEFCRESRTQHSSRSSYIQIQ